MISMAFENQWIFRFNFVNKIVSLFTEIIFITVFWGSLMYSDIIISEWSVKTLMVFISFTILSSGLSKIFFGFRDFEFKVLKGEFDTVLVKPCNPVLYILMEKFNPVQIFGKLLISLSALIIFTFIEDYSLFRLFVSALVVILSTLCIEFLYGSVTLLTFYLGRVYILRELLFFFRDINKYPLSLYPRSVITFFTHILPVGLLSWWPTLYLTEMNDDGFYYFALSFILALVSTCAFTVFLRKSLRKYTSSGS